MENLKYLLGNEELTTILALVGDFTKASYIDVEKLSKLSTVMLRTLADEKYMFSPKIEVIEFIIIERLITNPRR